MRARVDAQAVETRFADGRALRIAWDDLVYVALIWRDSSDRFFWEDPGYWELQAIDGRRCHVYRRVAQRIGLLDYLARLPRFSLAAAKRALDERGYAPVWQRDVVRCPSCAAASMEAVPQVERQRWDCILRCPACGTDLMLGRERVAR
jgi:hypothetical protein